MSTSDENPIQASEDVTPDLVAQKDEGFGVVGEIKVGLSNDPEHWQAYAEQLRKYDDDELEGWWTDDGKIPASDTVMLVHQPRRVRFVRLLEELRETQPKLVGPSTVVVEFNRSDQAAPYYFFRAEWGEFQDSELEDVLGEGQMVPLHSVIGSFGTIRFYDTPPPLPALLNILWTDLFPAWQEERGELDTDTGAYLIRVTIDEVTSELQRAYGSGQFTKDNRSAEFPRRSWIRKALEALVSLNMAYRPNKPTDGYVIQYRTFKSGTDSLRRFIELIEDTSEDNDDAEQAELPLEGNDT